MLNLIEVVSKIFGKSAVAFDARPTRTFNTLSKYGDYRYFLAPEVPISRNPAPRIQVTRKNGFGELSVSNNATLDEAISALQQGGAVGIQNVSDFNEEIKMLCSQYLRGIDTANDVFANAYVSAPGSTVGAHFDPEHVFFVQLSGRRRWEYSVKPAAITPLTSLAADWVSHKVRSSSDELPYSPVGIEDCTMETCELSAGDCLYLPPGCWHQPTTIGDDASLHITLSIKPFTVFDLVLQNLKIEALENSELRAEISRTEVKNDEFQTAISLLNSISDFKALTNRSRIGRYAKSVRKSFWNY